MALEQSQTRHIVLLGDSNIGKTSMIQRKVSKKFIKSGVTVAGLDCASDKHTTNLLGFKAQRISIKIWDTVGTEKYMKVAKTFLKRSDGFIVCFDISNEKSFANLGHWLNEIDLFGHQDVPVILVGTKSDLNERRSVSRKEAQQYADERSMYYVECSSLSGTGINEAFFLIYDMAILYKFKATKEMICSFTDMQDQQTQLSQVLLTDGAMNGEEIEDKDLISINPEVYAFTRANSLH